MNTGTGGTYDICDVYDIQVYIVHNYIPEYGGFFIYVLGREYPLSKSEQFSNIIRVELGSADWS